MARLGNPMAVTTRAHETAVTVSGGTIGTKIVKMTSKDASRAGRKRKLLRWRTNAAGFWGVARQGGVTLPHATVNENRPHAGVLSPARATRCTAVIGNHPLRRTSRKPAAESLTSTRTGSD